MDSKHTKWRLLLILIALVGLASVSTAATPTQSGVEARLRAAEDTLLLAEHDIEALQTEVAALRAQLLSNAESLGGLGGQAAALSADVARLDNAISDLAAPPSVVGAIDVFIKFNGIDGESQDKDHKGAIDVLAWSWGASNPGGSSAGGATAGKVNVQDFSIVKRVDKSSPALFLSCATGKHIPDVVVTVRKAGETPLEYLIIRMKDVRISSYQPSASSDVPLESISFTFAKVEIEVYSQAADGSVLPPTRGSWDVATNAQV